MTKKETIGVVLLVAGVVVLIVSVAADAIGVGRFPGFGLRQGVGAAAGAIAVFVGVILRRRP